MSKLTYPTLNYKKYSQTKPVISVSDVSCYPHEKRQEHPLPTELAGLLGQAWPGESAKHDLGNV